MFAQLTAGMRPDKQTVFDNRVNQPWKCHITENQAPRLGVTADSFITCWLSWFTQQKTSDGSLFVCMINWSLR